MDGKNILIADRWRLRYLDKWNYILEEWRWPKVSELNTGVQIEQISRWYAMSGNPGTGPFFGKLGDALEWLLHYRVRDEIPDDGETIKETVARMRSIADELKQVRLDG